MPSIVVTAMPGGEKVRCVSVQMWHNYKKLAESIMETRRPTVHGADGRKAGVDGNMLDTLLQNRTEGRGMSQVTVMNGGGGGGGHCNKPLRADRSATP